MSLSRRLLGALALLGLLGATIAMVPSATATTSASSKVGSCAGFKNRPGMTDHTIKIGNASDISGPQPGLYTGAQDAVRAYVAYFNASKRICGRKLVLDRRDSRTDRAGDKKAAQAMCAGDFAAVGSMSDFDNGGAAMTQACRLPDLRATSQTAARNRCTTCFGVDATRTGVGTNSVPDYFVAQRPAAVQKAAILWLNVPSFADHAKTVQKVEAARGFHFVYSAAIDIADFNYGPYVSAMKSKGVRLVQFLGADVQTVRLAQFMTDNAFHPSVFLAGTSAYDYNYVAQGGSAVEGTIVPINFLPLNAGIQEMNLYRTWLAQVSPGAQPTPEGLFAWSAAKLFTTEALSLGGKLSRKTLIARLRTVKGWTGGGLHVPMAVGAKQVAPCTRLLQLHNGTWISIGGTAYRCTGLTTVG